MAYEDFHTISGETISVDLGEHNEPRKKNQTCRYSPDLMGGGDGCMKCGRPYEYHIAPRAADMKE